MQTFFTKNLNDYLNLVYLEVFFAAGFLADAVEVLPVAGFFADEVPVFPAAGFLADVLPVLPVEGFLADVLPVFPVEGFLAELPVFPLEGFFADVFGFFGFSSSSSSLLVSVETRFIIPPKSPPPPPLLFPPPNRPLKKPPPLFWLFEPGFGLGLFEDELPAFDIRRDAMSGAAADRILFVLFVLTPVSPATSFVVAELTPRRDVIIASGFFPPFSVPPAIKGMAAASTLLTCVPGAPLFSLMLLTFSFVRSCFNMLLTSMDILLLSRVTL
jgi:hypothetical protein